MEILNHDIQQYTLRRNHRRSFPRKVLFFDTETQQHKGDKFTHHSMRLAWSCYTERRPVGIQDTESWREWYDAKSLCEYIRGLCHDKTALYIMAHNVFFDLQVAQFFRWFTSWGWELDFIHEQGTTYILVIHKGKKRIKAVSTTNYYNTSVEKLGRMINLPKLDVDFKMVDTDTLSRYCRRDVEIIKEAMARYFEFIRRYDLGKFSLTRASQAFAAFRHRFMTHKINIHHDKRIQNIEQESYIGGRVECFHIGNVPDGPFVSLDINSMYPYVMSRFPSPTRTRDYREGTSLDHIEEVINHSLVIADCDIDTDMPIYPLRNNGKIIFPTGKFRCVLCTPELREAINRNHITKVYRHASYDSEYIFKAYVDFFYPLRLIYKDQKDDIHTELCKNFLNYLYGKFGQYRPLQEVERSKTHDGYYRLETLDMVTGETITEYKLFNTIVRQTGRELARSSFLAIASHITSYARWYLWSIIEQLGIERVLYCDTDSIKIKKIDLPFVKHPIHQTDLGALKVEGEYNSLEIFGPKNYKTDTIYRLKGVPRSAIEIEPNVYRYDSFLKQRTHMRERIDDTYITRPVIKIVTSTYDKGIVHDDGHVTPLHL